MNLEQTLDAERLKLRSESYQMSVGELANLYVADELRVAPAFQRVLRWELHQKVAFIESILLQFPLPSIFVAARSNGAWDLLDGLQRITTVFEFLGILRTQDGANIAPPLRLTATERVRELEGVTFLVSESSKGLPERLRLDFKRQRMDVKIILRESDDEMLYDLYTRLNIGGATMSSQDVRHAIISQMEYAFLEWLAELKGDQHYVSTLALSDNDLNLRYDEELLLTFILASSDGVEELRQVRDLDETLTSLSKSRSSRLYQYDREVIAATFREVFRSLDTAGGSQAIESLVDVQTRGRRVSGISREAFTVVSAALAEASRLHVLDKVIERLMAERPSAPVLLSFADQVEWGRALARMP